MKRIVPFVIAIVILCAPIAMILSSEKANEQEGHLQDLQINSENRQGEDSFINIQNLTGHPERVQDVKFSSDGKYLASGNSDDTLIIWDTATWEITKQLTISLNGNCFDWSPNGEYLAVGSGNVDQMVRILDTDTWEIIETITLSESGHGMHGDVSFSPNGYYLAASSDHEAQIFETKTWKKVRTLVGDDRYSQQIAIFSPYGSYFAMSNYQMIKIYRTDTWTVQETISPPHYCEFGAFSQDEEYFAYTYGVHDAGNREIVVRETTDWEIVDTLTENPYNFQLDFSQNGDNLACGSNDSVLRIWDTSEWKIKQELVGHSEAVITVDFSSDGVYLASGSEDKTIKIWKLIAPEPLNTVSGKVTYSGGGKDGQLAINSSVEINDQVTIVRDDGRFSILIPETETILITVTPPDEFIGEIDVKSGYLPQIITTNASESQTLNIPLEYYDIREIKIISPAANDVFEPAEEIQVYGSSMNMESDTTIMVTLGTETKYGNINADGDWSITIVTPYEEGTYPVLVSVEWLNETVDIVIEERPDVSDESKFRKTLITFSIIGIILFTIIILIIGKFIKADDERIKSSRKKVLFFTSASAVILYIIATTIILYFSFRTQLMMSLYFGFAAIAIGLFGFYKWLFRIK